MKIIHTIESTRRSHGGPSRSVPSLCESLGALNCDVHLLAATNPTEDENHPAPPVMFEGVPAPKLFTRLRLGGPFRNRLKDLTQSSRKSTIVHDHGLWLPSNHAVARVCSERNICRIVATRGMVSAWSLANSNFKKKLPWAMFQKNDLKTATAFHATSQLEADEIRSLGLTQPIAVIPNGVSAPAKLPARKTDDRVMLFLSRIHPKKGLLNLVTAWNQAAMAKTWRLVIAGPDESGHLAQVRQEVARLKLSDSIEFPGSVDDIKKWQLFADADVFVLPSFSENFGIVVAEAMAAGLPVITTMATPWQDVVRRNCGWCIAPDVNELQSTLKTIRRMNPRKLTEMGSIARQWANSAFAWPAVASQMYSVYSWLLGRDEMPDCVQISNGDD